jgi:hypothetical protein
MGRWLLAVWMMCAVCVGAPVSSLAAGKKSDVVATRTYLRASYSYALKASAGLDARVAALEARASEIAGECPSALIYAPRDQSFAELGEEAITEVVYTGAVTGRSLLVAIAREIGHLVWSNPRVTRLVHFRAAEEQGVARIALPDVCADIAAWKASAYAVLPQSASEFLARSEAIEAESFVGGSETSRETAILRLLKPYENAAGRTIAKHLERLETRLGNRIYAAISAVRAKLEGALGDSAL